jgi:predicted transcriptional regulator
MIDPLNPATLKDAREAAGLTRGELATKSGVHETTILRIEKGSVDPRLDGTWAPLVRAVQAEASRQADTAA